MAVYGFKSRQVATRLKQMAAAAPGSILDRPSQSDFDKRSRSLYGSQYLVLTPAGGIPKKEGGILGTAQCTIEWIDNADMAMGLPNPAGSLVQTTVWNNSTEDIPGDTVIVASDIYGKPVVDAPVAAQPPDVKPRPWMKFTTNDKMSSETIQAVIDLVEPGNLINPSTSLPWAPGDAVTLNDPHNQWALAEANATGTAYYRVSANRWEIQTCSLPAEYVNGTLYIDGGPQAHLVPGDVLSLEVDISGTVDKPWSHPGVDPPPELVGDLIPCTNPFRFSAKGGSEVVIRRVSKDQSFADASSLSLDLGSSINEEWQIVRVKEPLARWAWIDAVKTPDSLVGKTITHAWDGVDPLSPVTVRVMPGFSIPCETPMICSFDPENSDGNILQYVATSAPTAMLPMPTVEDIHVRDMTASGCSIDYKKRKGYFWNEPSGSGCEEKITDANVALTTTSVQVVDSITYDATGLTWSYSTVEVCSAIGGGTGTLPFVNCPPPDDPCGYTTYQWNQSTRTWDFVSDNCVSPCIEDVANRPQPPADPADDPPDGTIQYVICIDPTA